METETYYQRLQRVDNKKKHLLSILFFFKVHLQNLLCWVADLTVSKSLCVSGQRSVMRRVGFDVPTATVIERTITFFFRLESPSKCWVWNWESAKCLVGWVLGSSKRICPIYLFSSRVELAWWWYIKEANQPFSLE